MIDVMEKNKSELQIVMHFVNKNRNPLEAPVIKKYWMSLDNETKVFLNTLQAQLLEESEYYQLLMKENEARAK